MVLSWRSTSSTLEADSFIDGEWMDPMWSDHDLHIKTDLISL